MIFRRFFSRGGHFYSGGFHFYSGGFLDFSRIFFIRVVFWSGGFKIHLENPGYHTPPRGVHAVTLEIPHRLFIFFVPAGYRFPRRLPFPQKLRNINPQVLLFPQKLLLFYPKSYFSPSVTFTFPQVLPHILGKHHPLL